VVSTPRKKYEFVSWDDDIPSIWKVRKFMSQTTSQYCISFSNWIASEIGPPHSDPTTYVMGAPVVGKGGFNSLLSFSPQKSS